VLVSHGAKPRGTDNDLHDRNVLPNSCFVNATVTCRISGFGRL
jgi:hypothetical protein